MVAHLLRNTVRSEGCSRLWTTTVFLAFSLFLTTSCSAEEPAEPAFDAGPYLTLTEENDFVNRTDRWYTQGAKIVYMRADNDLPRWSAAFLNWIPALGFSPGANRIGYQVGQSLFTPADTHAYPPDPNDRPYAGWLYTGMMLQRTGMGIGHYLTVENFQLDIGIIGPDAVAEDAQSAFHHETPRGWHYQLKDEPGIAVKYGRAWLVPIPTAAKRYLDFIPLGGLSVGNADTSFRAGATFRAGYNLPDNFGVHPIESVIPTQGGWSPSRVGRQWGFYVFSGVEGRAVLYNAFLDGNAFRDGPSVDKEPIVGEWRSGLVVVLNRVELAYTHIIRTREFRGQPDNHIYGSINLIYKF